jgi:hypothetical protein
MKQNTDGLMTGSTDRGETFLPSDKMPSYRKCAAPIFFKAILLFVSWTSESRLDEVFAEIKFDLEPVL